MPVVNDRFRPSPFSLSVLPVVIEPLRLLGVPKNTVPAITGVGEPPVGVTPALRVEVAGTVPSAINTLPVATLVGDCAWITVAVVPTRSPITIAGLLAPLAA